MLLHVERADMDNACLRLSACLHQRASLEVEPLSGIVFVEKMKGASM